MKTIRLVTLPLLLAVSFGAAHAQDVAPVPAQVNALTLAMRIVYAQSTELDGRNKAAGLAGTGSNLNVDVKVMAGYADKPSLEYPTGIDKRAMIEMSYPLYGGVTSTDKDRANALHARNVAQDNLRITFLKELQRLSMLLIKLNMEKIKHSKAYRMMLRARNVNDKADCVIRTGEKKAKIPGCTSRPQDRVEIASLIDKSTDLQVGVRIAEMELVSNTELVARQFGKAEWDKLQIHIRAAVKGIGG